MASPTSQEIAVLFLALGLLLATARLFTEIAKCFNQPMDLGEILAGVFWGPTIVGILAPHFSIYLPMPTYQEAVCCLW
ncbi:MAG: hypothetical protein IBX46_02980 [Desulfuromonadales bacterium]|nr:hypothetical protein [Desulfuromonadales bacterium]